MATVTIEDIFMRAILTAAALVSTALLATACHPKQDAAASNEAAPVVDEGNVIDATNEATTNETAPADANSTGEEGKAPGDFHAVHHLATDSKGNIYTVEVQGGSRVQRFLFKGIKPKSS